MSRRNAAVPRVSPPDYKYGSPILSKFICKIMHDGKKTIAEKIVYGALNHISKKHNVDGFEVFNVALNNIKPSLELISVRVGGANYQVPARVSDLRGITLAMLWLINASRSRSEKTMLERLAAELFDAYQNRGGAMKKREDTAKMAESNRAFAHLNPRKTRLA